MTEKNNNWEAHHLLWTGKLFKESPSGGIQLVVTTALSPLPDELEHEIQRMQRDHLRKMYDLQREIERMRQETMVDRLRLEMQVNQQPTRIILQQQPAPAPPAQQPTQVSMKYSLLLCYPHHNLPGY